MEWVRKCLVDLSAGKTELVLLNYLNNWGAFDTGLPLILENQENSLIWEISRANLVFFYLENQEK